MKSTLAIFLEKIGIDLKDEEQPELKTIPLTKTVKKVINGRVCSVEVEYGKEYHILPYKAFGSEAYTSPQERARTQTPIVTIDSNSVKGQKIAGYLNNVFLEAANKQPIPYYNRYKSSSYGAAFSFV